MVALTESLMAVLKVSKMVDWWVSNLADVKVLESAANSVDLKGVRKAGSLVPLKVV